MAKHFSVSTFLYDQPFSTKFLLIWILIEVSDVKKLIVGDNKNDFMESCEVTVQRSSGSFGGLNSAVDGERDEMTLIKLAPLIEVKKSIKH